MRLSDAGLRQRRTKVLYPNHRLPPWLTEDAPRDRSNRLLDVAGGLERYISLVPVEELTSLQFLYQGHILFAAPGMYCDRDKHNEKRREDRCPHS